MCGRADADKWVMRRLHLALPLAACALAASAPSAFADLTITPLGNEGHTKDTAPTISGQAWDEAGDGAIVYVTIRNLANGDEYGADVERSGTTWSAEAGDTLPEGRFRITAEQERPSGIVSATAPLFVDLTPPAAPILNVYGKDDPNGTRYTLTTVLAGFYGDPQSTYECAIDAGAFAACTVPWQTTVAAGQHTMRVRAIDRAGNAGPAAEQRITALGASVLMPKPPARPPGTWPGYRGAGAGAHADILAGARTRVSRKGRVTVKLANRNPFALRGRLELRTVDRVRIGSGPRRIRTLAVAGMPLRGARSLPTTATARLTLDRSERRLVASKRRGLRARLTLRLTDEAGIVRRVTRRTVLVSR